MVWIRIFRTRKEAEAAREILEEGRINAWITEDKFNGVPIQKYRVPARFRLNVAEEDFSKTAKFLAGKIKKK